VGLPFAVHTIRVPKLFATWRGKASSAEINTARTIVGRLVTALRAAESPAAAQQAIKIAVRALNAADTFIETVEREDLCALLSELGQSAGIAKNAVDALIDRERDW
jgi:G:T/U-mismatch repair DNA glycosylase